MSENISKLRFYSYGIVAADKKRNSNEIVVTPVEDFPMMHGNITGVASDYNASVKTVKGGSEDVSVKVSDSLPATWLPLGDCNRLTSPDVRRGHPVMIYQFGDAEQYYWETVGNDLKFRRRETVIFGISATADENAVPNKTNTYIFEMSSHEKHIRLITTQADGEPFGYEVKLNTADGVFSIEDTVGNKLILDSKQNQLRFDNAVGNYFELVQNIFNMFTNDQINLKTNAMTVNANTLDITAQTSHKGDISHKGDYGQKGNHGVDGNFAVEGGGKSTFSGDIDGKANINLDGTIAADVGNFRSSCTAPNIN